MESFVEVTMALVSMGDCERSRGESQDAEGVDWRHVRKPLS